MRTARLVSLISIGILLTGMLGPGAGTASAAIAGPTFTVNSTANGEDAAPGDDECATTGDVCTLRAAIQEANASSDINHIEFDLTGTGIHTILVTSLPLPQIIYGTHIDGSTQPGCAAPCIALDGSSLGPAHYNGLQLFTDNSTIQSLIIHSFTNIGIWVDGNGNKLKGNYVGVVPGDSDAHPNSSGIFLDGSNNIIGGSTAAARNVISGNSNYGIVIGHDPAGSGSGNIVRGNYVGIDPTGTTAMGNGDFGILVDHTMTGTRIGGTTAGTGNVISGNLSSAIVVEGDDTVIKGNIIGTRADGTGSVPNLGLGIGILDTANGTLIGGATSAEKNRIANSSSDGIAILGTNSTITTMRRNLIYANAGEGIDLGYDGVTSNDGQDADSGPNGLQNFPLINSANSTTDTIVAKLYSKPNVTYTFEFFSSPAGSCDPSGYGEGQKYLGKVTGTTDDTGYVRVTFTSTVGFIAGEVITATVTNSQGKTSEFSKCKTAG